MKVLLVSLNFAPEITGIGKYSGELADGLVARGHELHVVCGPPYYPSWRVAPGHRAGRWHTDSPRPGLVVHRCPLWLPRRLGALARLLHLTSFAVSSLPVLLRLVLWRPQVVFVVAPALFCAPGAWLAARLAGARTWLHVQDFEVDAAFGLGMLERPLLRRVARFVERQILGRFDVVSTISRRMVRQLALRGIPLHRTAIVPNGIQLSQVRPGPVNLAMRAEFGISDRATVCLFSGTLNRKQGAGVLLEAARLLSDHPDLVFVVCGEGEMRAELERAAVGLSNVRFGDLQPVERLDALLNMADIHLLPQLPGAADLVMPSKLVGMLASGRPIVACTMDDSEIASVVRNCGIVVRPQDAPVMAAAIVELAADAPRRLALGRAGRAYAERVLDAEQIFDTLHERLLALHRHPAPPPLPYLPVRQGEQG